MPVRRPDRRGHHGQAHHRARPVPQREEPRPLARPVRPRPAHDGQRPRPAAPRPDGAARRDPERPRRQGEAADNTGRRCRTAGDQPGRAASHSGAPPPQAPGDAIAEAPDGGRSRRGRAARRRSDLACDAGRPPSPASSPRPRGASRPCGRRSREVRRAARAQEGRAGREGAGGCSTGERARTPARGHAGADRRRPLRGGGDAGQPLREGAHVARRGRRDRETATGDPRRGARTLWRAGPRGRDGCRAEGFREGPGRTPPDRVVWCPRARQAREGEAGRHRVAGEGHGAAGQVGGRQDACGQTRAGRPLRRSNEAARRRRHTPTREHRRPGR